MVIEFRYEPVQRSRGLIWMELNRESRLTASRAVNLVVSAERHRDRHQCMDIDSRISAQI